MHPLFSGIVSGNRAALAKAITLVESTLAKHNESAQVLLSQLMQRQKQQSTDEKSTYSKSKSVYFNKPKSLRIAISGPPGAGKSSFLEEFGCYLIDKKLKLAILAVDPSSSVTGGSLLGDKTRMPKLSANTQMAYIRPSPSGCNLGGVTRSTNEAILLCEAAGYDVIFVETVGVGQSEHTVSNMVDLYMLLTPPAAGDDLQGIKRGIMEVAQMILVTKYDGDLVKPVERTVRDLKVSTHYLRPTIPDFTTKVIPVSTKTSTNIDTVYKEVINYWDNYYQYINENRINQKSKWLWYHIERRLIDRFKTDENVKINLKKISEMVVSDQITPGKGSDILIDHFITKN